MKKVKILTITLAIILITAIAFGGIYVQKQNRMENIIKDYEYAMDLKGTRTIRLQPKKEEGEAEEVNAEDCKKTKEIIEKRFEKTKLNNYTIKVNEQTGEIVVEIPENETTNSIVGQIATTGKFEIQDSETGEVLMNNSDIKLANVSNLTNKLFYCGKL